VAIAEMCIGGRLGAELRLETSDAVRTLFGETTGCLVIEVPAKQKDELLALFKDLPVHKIGTVIQEAYLKIRLSIRSSVSHPLRTSVENIRSSVPHPLRSSVEISVADLVRAWNHPLQ
jgi:phosphoribosylformylglycinamidine (FGAM) synthase-like enzyme